jgi:hypothetical protein
MAKLKWTPRFDRPNVWRQADDFLGEKNTAVIGNNTRLVRKGRPTLTQAREIAVILHRTAIVTYYPDGRIVLDAAGYRTRTTAQRLNALSPIPIYSVKGQWIFRDPETKEVLPFEDGLTLKWEPESMLHLPPLRSGSIAQRAARAKLFGV